MFSPHDSEEISQLMENFNYDKSRAKEILSKYNRLRVLYHCFFETMTKENMNVTNHASELLEKMLNFKMLKLHMKTKN